MLCWILLLNHLLQSWTYIKRQNIRLKAKKKNLLTVSIWFTFLLILTFIACPGQSRNSNQRSGSAAGRDSVWRCFQNVLWILYIKFHFRITHTHTHRFNPTPHIALWAARHHLGKNHKLNGCSNVCVCLCECVIVRVCVCETPLIQQYNLREAKRRPTDETKETPKLPKLN